MLFRLPLHLAQNAGPPGVEVTAGLGLLLTVDEKDALLRMLAERERGPSIPAALLISAACGRSIKDFRRCCNCCCEDCSAATAFSALPLTSSNVDTSIRVGRMELRFLSGFFLLPSSPSSALLPPL